MKWPFVLLSVVLTFVLVPAKPPSSRIIGGQASYETQFPWASAIHITKPDGNYFCTGSLITNSWILTAGQCVIRATSFTITMGTILLNGDASTVEKHATDTYVLHPEFDPVTLANDIGLIKLRMSVTLTDYVKPVNLPLNPMVASEVGLALGWGQTSDTNSSLAETLNFVNLRVVSDAECRLTYGGQLADNMVCFEGAYNEGTCFGDSGSPVVRHINRVYVVILAVASFFSGNGCESTDPSGYIAIYPYNDWIRNVTTPANN